MKNLDTTASVCALFVLSSDVAKLSVHGTHYFYCKPNRKGDVGVIRYILKKNDIPSELHRTHYYSNSRTTDLVVRFYDADLDRCKVPDFKEQFEYSYKNKTDMYASDAIIQKRAPLCFRLWPKVKKINFINKIANMTR